MVAEGGRSPSRPRCKLLSLNVQGLGAQRQAQTLQYLLEGDWNVACLQDTHFRTAEAGEKWLKEGMGHASHPVWPGTGFFAPTSSSSVGGTAILFKRSFPGNILPEANPVLCEEDPLGRILRVDFSWEDQVFSLFSVYAPAVAGERADFFTRVLHPAVEASRRQHGEGTCTHHVLIGGDFNCVMGPKDHTGNPGRTTRYSGARQLRQVQDAQGLVDAWEVMHPEAGIDVGRTHVHIPTATVARLDRWLVPKAIHTRGWLQASKVHHCPVSDHLGVTMHLTAPRAIARGPGFWALPLHVLDDDGWCDAVTREWQRRVALPLATDRRQRWDGFKTWVQAYTVHHQAEAAARRRDAMRALQRRAEAALRTLARSPGDRQAQMAYIDVMGDMRCLNIRKARDTGVQAGIVWQDFGERPTHIFHQMGRWRAQDSTFTHVRAPGDDPASPPVPFTDDTQPWALETAAVHFAGDSPHGLYRAREVDTGQQDLILESCTDRVTAQGVAACLGPDGDGRLTTEECRKALWALARGKRPGSDGIPPEFYRTFWDLLGEELTLVLNEAFDDPTEDPMLSPSQRHGFTVLIYKGEGDRADVMRYRPLTMLNSDYKILAKLLATRLGLALVDVIHPTQTAFVPGRWLGANVLCHLDLVDVVPQAGRCGAIVFTDFIKAYDTLDRGWLLRCMHHVGLPAQFIRWAKILMAGNVNQLLVNGFPTREFPVVGGVRQGCPASPPLYIVALQPLATHLRRLALEGSIRPIPWPGAPPEISWQHADDLTLHLHPDSVGPAFELGLRPFSRASGQELNLSKCSILPLGGDMEALRMTGIRLVGRGEIVRHLGVPLGLDVDISPYCLDIVRGLEQRAAWWSSVRLSFLGQVYVAKQELASRLVHILTFLTLPEDLMRRAERALASFMTTGKLGRHTRLHPSLHVLGLDWDYGGCRAPDVRSVTKALQAKVMAFLMEPTVAPWKPVMTQWWDRRDEWHAFFGTSPRMVDRWGLGGNIALTTYPLEDLAGGRGVPHRVLGYVRAFRELQPHYDQERAATTPEGLLRQPAAYHPLLQDPPGTTVCPDHPRWRALFAMGVRRLGDVRALMADGDAGALQALARRFWVEVVPGHLRALVREPGGMTPEGAWLERPGDLPGRCYRTARATPHGGGGQVQALPFEPSATGELLPTGPLELVTLTGLRPAPVERFQPRGRRHAADPPPGAPPAGGRETGARGDEDRESFYYLGPLHEGFDRTGWYLGSTHVYHYTTSEATQRRIRLQLAAELSLKGQPRVLPIRPAIWGEGLWAVQDREIARARGQPDMTGYPIDRGPAWMRESPRRPARGERAQHREQAGVLTGGRDFTVDPIAGLIPPREERPEWAGVWKTLRDPTLNRQHRSVAFLILHGSVRRLGGFATLHLGGTTPHCPHRCCTRDVETLTHAFLGCPVAQTVTTWLGRVLAALGGGEAPITPDSILVGNWDPEDDRFTFIWHRLRLACLAGLLHHRNEASVGRADPSPEQVVTMVVRDVSHEYFRDCRRLSPEAYRLPGVCEDWLRGRRPQVTQAEMQRRWEHPGLTEEGLGGSRRFVLSAHRPVDVRACMHPALQPAGGRERGAAAAPGRPPGHSEDDEDPPGPATLATGPRVGAADRPRPPPGGGPRPRKRRSEAPPGLERPTRRLRFAEPGGLEQVRVFDAEPEARRAMAAMYMERQDAAWCPVHSANAFLGGPAVSRGDITEYQHEEVRRRLASRPPTRRADGQRRPDAPIMRPIGPDGGVDVVTVVRFLRERCETDLVPLESRYCIRRGMSRWQIVSRLGRGVTRALVYDTRRAHAALWENADPDARGIGHSVCIRRVPGYPGYWALLDSFLDGPRLLGHDADARWEDLDGLVFVPRDEAIMTRVPEFYRPTHDGGTDFVDLTGDD